MTEWKPIETAPKTDDPILVAYDDGTVEVVDDSDETDWQPYTGGSRFCSSPTHWMELPAAPITRQPEETNE